MDASLQLRKPRKSIRTLAGAAGASHLFRRLIPLKIKDGIFVCHRMSKLESLSAHANGTCHRAIISQRCWLRASFVTRQANRSPSLIWMDIKRGVCFRAELHGRKTPCNWEAEIVSGIV